MKSTTSCPGRATVLYIPADCREAVCPLCIAPLFDGGVILPESAARPAIRASSVVDDYGTFSDSAEPAGVPAVAVEAPAGCWRSVPGIGIFSLK